MRDEELKIDYELSLLKLPQSKFDVSCTSFNKQLYDDIIGYEAKLQHDLPNFIEQTIKPINELREDIQYYVETNRDQLMLGL